MGLRTGGTGGGGGSDLEKIYPGSTLAPKNTTAKKKDIHVSSVSRQKHVTQRKKYHAWTRQKNTTAKTHIHVFPST